jgi:ribonuclease HII
MVDRVGLTIGILGLWLATIFGILELPQNFPPIYGVPEPVIVTIIAFAAIGCGWILVPNERQREAQKATVQDTKRLLEENRALLARAVSAHKRKDIDWPTSSDSYLINLGQFRDVIERANDKGRMRSVPQEVTKALQSIVDRYDVDFSKIDDEQPSRIFLHDRELLILVKSAIAKIDRWLDKWQKSDY